MKLPSTNRGAALVAVLAVVVLMTILVTGLTMSLRLDRQAAFYHLERTRADLMANEGVEYGEALLRGTVGDPDRVYLSSPGRLHASAANSASKALVTTPIELSSGAPGTPQPGVLAPANLNRRTWSGNDRILDPNGGNFDLKWVYVRNDGSRDPDELPAVSGSNPILGRYAFWVDDESSRVNLNTAWKRQTNVGLANPSQVNLTALNARSTSFNSTLADAIRARVLPVAGGVKTLNSPMEAISIATNTGQKTALKETRFVSTFYNQDTELIPIGKHQIGASPAMLQPKIVLTTRSNVANGRPFLDILTSDTADPALTASISPTKLDLTLKKLVSLFSSSNYGYAPGMSLAGKYRPGNPQRITQLALDIIDYVRSAESSTNLVYPLRGRWNAGNWSMNGGDMWSDDSFVSTGRHPLITEVGILVSDTPPFKLRVFVELYLPPSYGLSSLQVVAVPRLTVNFWGYDPSNPHTTAQLQDQEAVATNYTLTAASPYTVISNKFEFAYPDGTSATGPTVRPAGSLGIRVAANVGGGNIDYCPLSSTTQIQCPINPVGTYGSTPAGVKSREVDDPRVNKNTADWVLSSGSNTFGAQNSIWGSKMTASVTPPADGTDAAASLRMPAKGVGVSSVAELGCVTTGVEVTGAGVPWRTVRLRPTPGSTVFPDWALLDIFTAPVWPTGQSQQNLITLYEPHKNSVAGRFNINTAVAPFSGADRGDILTGLLNEAGLTSQTAAIRAHTLASGGRDYGLTGMYDSIGELAEIQGVADGNESSEQNLAKLVNLAGVKGSVFSIYSIGQALKQTPNGTLKVNGEKILQVMVERYVEDVVSGGMVTDRQMKFRVVYKREISL